MCFSERRGRRRRRDPRALALLAAASLILVATRAAASPIDDPFVTGMSFSGPTSGDLGAIYWNPAALGLMRGFQLMVAGTARWSSVGASLPALGSQPAGSATATDFRQPFQWPPGPRRLRGARVRQRSVHDRLRDVHAVPRTDPFSDLGDGQRADPLPGVEHGSAQPGAGAGAGDPVGQRPPDRSVVRVHVLDRQPQLRRGPERRAEPGRRRPLQHQLGPGDRRREVLGHARRRNLLAPQESGARRLVPEPSARRPGGGRRGRR